jgi:predicted metal-binding membrane protein
MTLVESIVRHERGVLMAALVAVPLLCAAWIVPMAWDAPLTTLLGAMWIVMMIGMMTPSAAPGLLLFAGCVDEPGRIASLTVSC